MAGFWGVSRAIEPLDSNGLRQVTRSLVLQLSDETIHYRDIQNVALLC